MALSDRAREFWRRRGYEQSAENYDKGQAKEVSRIVIPAKTSLGESEAVSAEGIPNIPFSVYPTPTINPPRPRTIAAGYNEEHQILRLKFRPGASAQSPAGAVYDYYGVTQAEWTDIRKRIINSTGRYLNDQLDTKEYVRLY